MKHHYGIPSAKRTSFFVVFIIMTFTLVYVLTSGIESAVDPVSLLPVNTALLVDMKKPATSITRLSQSHIGRQMTAVVWKQVLRDTGMPEGDIQYFVNRTRALKKAINSTFFGELLGKRVLLGLIPAPVDKELLDNEEKPAHQMVIIARPLHKASLVDFLSKFFISMSKYTERSYKGRVVKTYVFDNNLSFSSSVTDGLIIASFSVEAVQRCIDISLKNMATGQSGLQENVTYNRLRKRAEEKDDLFVYISFPSLRNTVHSTVDMDYSLQDTIQHVAFFRQPQKSLFRYSGIIQYNPDGAQQGSSFLQHYKPGRDVVLGQLPADILAHVWTNNFDVDAVWGLMQSRPYNFMQPYLHKMEKWLLENTALTVSDFLSLFRHRASLNVTEIKSSVFFPMPRIYLRIEVNDQEKAGHLLKQLFAGLPVQQSTINNTKVFTIMMAGGLIQPSYMLTDGFLVLGDSRQQLEDFLTNDRATLLSSPLFEKIDVGLAQKNNLIIYHRGAQLIDGLKELLLWYSSLLPHDEKKSGQKSKVIINTVLIPVLENMKKYKAKSVRIYNTGSEIVMQSALLVEK